MSEQRRIILASTSKRIKELMALLGIVYEIREPDADESVKTADPAKLVLETSKPKAMSIGAPESIIIGADTVVALDKDILDKPRDNQGSVRMFCLLSGKTHYVYTGVCIRDTKTGETVQDLKKTAVKVCCMTLDEITRYVETGEPFDKAGAYGIQGYFAPYVEAIDGCYFNVVGLPLNLLKELLKQLNINI